MTRNYILPESIPAKYAGLSQRKGKLHPAAAPQNASLLPEGISCLLPAGNKGVKGKILPEKAAQHIPPKQGKEVQDNLHALGLRFSMLVHQLKTPLSTALLYTSHLDVIRGTAKRNNCIKELSFSLHELDLLVKSLLWFACEGVPEKDTVQVARLTDEISRWYRKLHTDSSHLQIEVTEAASQAYLEINLLLMLSALQNLIENAAEISQGKAIVALHFSLSRDQHNLLIMVTDNGPGMPFFVLRNVFEPFRASCEGGVGLGLPFVKTIVTAHGGTVCVNSRINMGCHFLIRLPLLQKH